MNIYNEKYNLPITITENGMNCYDLVSLDYTSQKRIIKDFGDWYKKVIAENGEGLSKTY